MSNRETTTNEETSRVEKHFEQMEVPEEAIERVGEMYRRIDEGEPAVEVLDVPRWVCPLAEMYARQMFNQGNYEDAMKMIDGVMALDESRYYPYLLVGLYLLQEERDYERAADFFAQAKELGPEDDPSITFNLGEAFILNGDFDYGIAQLDETLRRTEDEPENVYRERALVLLERFRQASEAAQSEESPEAVERSVAQ